jgi:peptidoglycan/LPS O-acetylase OafA/YrhL
MSEKPGQGEQRIGRLDGIRAIAIMLVYLHHTGFISVGWVGVNLFFVLSGFLITGILRRARTDRSFWAPFYIKRATRIIPPLVVLFVGIAIFCTVSWRQVGFYHFFFLSNIALVLYPSQLQPFAMLWSLSVEEHFYIFWPFAIRFLERKQLIWLLIGLLVVEPLLRAVATPFFHTWLAIYFLTPFQLDGLAAGSLLALLVEDVHAREQVARWSVITAIAALVIFLGLSRLPLFEREANSILFNSLGYSLVAVFSVSLVAYVFLHKDAVVSRLLSAKGIVFLGTISYGFYLFQGLGIMLVPTLATLLHGTNHIRHIIPLTVIPITVASWLSFRFYETPIILWGRRKAREVRLASDPVVHNVPL